MFLLRKTLPYTALLPIVALTGCSLFDQSDVEVEVSVNPATITDTVAVVVTVSAHNGGLFAANLGLGSSSCILSAVVDVAGRKALVSQNRFCTADVTKQTIPPGEIRVESWEWAGRVFLDGQGMKLAPGSYEIRGVAGKQGTGGPFVFHVE